MADESFILLFPLFLGICATCSYFGDKLLALRQIYKVIDNIFDTMTLISQEADDLDHDSFVNHLMRESLVQGVVVVGKRRNDNKTNLAFNPSLVGSNTLERLKIEARQEDDGIGRGHEDVDERENSLEETTSDESCSRSHSSESSDSNDSDMPLRMQRRLSSQTEDTNTQMSSIVLMPLARISISTAPELPKRAYV
jgi:hypothetical protein